MLFDSYFLKRLYPCKVRVAYYSLTSICVTLRKGTRCATVLSSSLESTRQLQKGENIVLANLNSTANLNEIVVAMQWFKKVDNQDLLRPYKAIS